MNPAQMSVGSLPSACQTGASGAFGPDRVTRFYYDNLDNLTRERRAVGTAHDQDYARFEYTGTRLDARIDAKGNRNEYSYDNYDRLTHWYFPSKTSPGSASSTDFEHYRYDAAGNRTYLRKRDGNVIRYSYDRLNRRTLKDVLGDSHDVYYRYNLQGLRTRARFGWLGGDGVTIEYNGFGEVTFEEIDMEGLRRHERYSYDANGNRISRRHSDDYGFNYQYDRLDRLTRVQDTLGRELAQYHYDRYARPKSLTTSGGANTQLGYEGIGRVSSISYNFSGGAEDLNLGFGYNPASQITRQTVSNGRYHHKGDRGLAGSYQVNGLNQYTRVAGQEYEYDDNGNLVSDGVNDYTYDVENRLIRVRGAYNADLVYDPLGRLFRITSHDTGQTRRFVYSGDQLTAEYRGEGDMLRRYAYGAGSRLAPLARYEGASLYPGNRRYLHTNHQGSVIAFSDKDGQATDLNTYDPFGVPGSGNTSRFSYTGQLWLAEIGLYHYRARVYNPYVGRFLQVDPIGYDDQMNLYAYVGNDPLNFTDPTGEFRRLVFRFLKEPIRTAKVATRAVKRAFKGDRDRKDSSGGTADSEIPEVPEAFSGSQGELPKPPRGPGSVPKAERDPKRTFSPSERAAKRQEQGGRCANGCGTEIDESNSQGHHIERHADGGPTTSENHAEVCTDCHKELHSPE